MQNILHCKLGWGWGCLNTHKKRFQNITFLGLHGSFKVAVIFFFFLGVTLFLLQSNYWDFSVKQLKIAWWTGGKKKHLSFCKYNVHHFRCRQLYSYYLNHLRSTKQIKTLQAQKKNPNVQWLEIKVLKKNHTPFFKWELQWFSFWNVFEQIRQCGELKNIYHNISSC